MQESAYRCGEYQVDIVNRRFTHNGHDVSLEPRVFAVIAVLLARSSKLVTRNDLLDAVWGHRYVAASTLNRTIALARRAFSDNADEPRYIQTVHGSGYCYVGPIEIPPAEEAGASATFGPPPIARLPERIEALIGREPALDAVSGMLQRGRGVTVAGTGGMGKTQCALEAARRVAGDFPDGVWFFDLAPHQNGEEWLRALSVALTLPPGKPEFLLSRVAALLHSRRLLLVLDNCDRVAAGAGAAVVALLRATVALKVLATSQVPLNYAGEQVLRVPPLALPARASDGSFNEQEIPQSPAVQLLVTRICALVPDFELTPANAATLAEICHQLDGMPLALELAAARFVLLSPEQVREHLMHRFRFLGGDTAGRDVRHRSLVSLLEWSYGLLSVTEQRLLNWCAAFVQTWSVDSTLDLAAALGHDDELAIDLLSGLVNRSLVSIVPGTVPPRYRLLETVREYALARLRATNEEELACEAHMQLVVRMCRAAHVDMLAGHMRERIEQLTQDRGNIMAAMARAMRRPEPRTAAMSILGSLLLYAKAYSVFFEIGKLGREFLDACAPSDAPEYGPALLTCGVMHVHLSAAGPWDDTLLAEAARRAASCGDWWTEGYAHGYQALGLANFGRVAEAENHVAITAQRAEQHDDTFLRSLTGLARGWIHLRREEPTAALDALMSARETGPDLFHRYFVNIYVGLAQFAVGELREAARTWLRGMRPGHRIANFRMLAGPMEGCVYLACKRAEWAGAARILAAAQGIRDRTGAPLFRLWVPHHEAALEAVRAHLTRGECEAALRAGAQMREEDAANEACVMLQRMVEEGFAR